jgi:hypothetical protein
MMTYLTVAVEAELPQACDDRFLGRIFIQRVDQNDPLAGGQRPGRVDPGADEIEIIEHLGRLGEPGCPVGRGTRRHVGTRARLRRHADARQGPGKIESGRRLGRRQMGVDPVRRRLRRCAGNAQPGHDDRRANIEFHGRLPSPRCMTVIVGKRACSRAMSGRLDRRQAVVKLRKSGL